MEDPNDERIGRMSFSYEGERDWVPEDDLGYRVKWDGTGEEPERPTDLRGAPFVHWFTPNYPTQALVGDHWTPTPRTAELDRHEALTKVALVTADPIRRAVVAHIPTCKDHNGGHGLAYCDEFMELLRALPAGDRDQFYGSIS